jgi:hypothetical protein
MAFVYALFFLLKLQWAAARVMCWQELSLAR